MRSTVKGNSSESDLNTSLSLSEMTQWHMFGRAEAEVLLLGLKKQHRSMFAPEKDKGFQYPATHTHPAVSLDDL